ncbi:unnamed protein product [Vicia faba]|uniref:Pentatricopeptide repeat-containing protein n=1 Tax=Vicia faba TaxID=3906 RepID=A0AAV0ZB31_VICFA|nr:unnamed protein product [Vicia faba]
MKNVHHIEPTLSHYACMIDMFGHAGLMEDAYNFIKSMPIEPDVIVWSSLLSSCRVHKNVDLAKVADAKLLLIDPNNSGAYLALANTFSACGKWEVSNKIRKLKKVQELSESGSVVTGFKMRVVTLNFYLEEENIKDNSKKLEIIGFWTRS